MQIIRASKKFLSLFLCFLLFVSGCSSSESNEGIENEETPSMTFVDILWPSSDNTFVESDDTVLVDYSHTSQGYITAKTLTSDHERIKIRIIHNEETYTYDINKENTYVTYPLNMGSGTYTINVFENTEGDNYVLLFGFDIDVVLDDEMIPFLYPNQVVDYDENTLCIQKSFELVEGITTDLERVDVIYHWVLENITYDWDKVEEVKGQYVIPVLDDIYNNKKGICFDYAALMAAMLRVQHIPTKVITGMVDEGYHAWIEVYIENMGWIKPHVYFNSGEWTTMDPTYDASNQEYEGPYTTKYTY